MKTPYYAVIFTSKQKENLEGYDQMANAMEALAQQQPGYLGMEHARDQLGITISYWESLEAITRWKENLKHQQAQHLGKEKWYKSYEVRICKVERAYSFGG
tara:strand:- start:13666 stop:13968 length:303 start_codon:yes stop_codon:yes gene_type:complete